MENSNKKKFKDEGIGWLTRPLYNIMLLCLVVLFTIQERNNNNYKDIFHVLMFISFGIIVIANVWNIFDFFKNFKKREKETEAGDEIADEE